MQRGGYKHLLQWSRRDLFHKLAFCRIIPAGAKIDMVNTQ
jgi:hypothetical protein